MASSGLQSAAHADLVLHHSFFFLLRPRPPKSTLFPYTTLFRSVITPTRTTFRLTSTPRVCAWLVSGPATSHAQTRGRSEEHTSELQSLTNLVCRLLLEKKKK